MNQHLQQQAEALGLTLKITEPDPSQSWYIISNSKGEELLCDDNQSIITAWLKAYALARYTTIQEAQQHLEEVYRDLSKQAERAAYDAQPIDKYYNPLFGKEIEQIAAELSIPLPSEVKNPN